MPRLIDADQIRIKPEYMHDICGVAMIRVEDIARILNDMPTIQPESHWTPCTPETMPEENQIVLITQIFCWEEYERGNEVTIAQYKRGYFTWYKYQSDWDRHTSVMWHGDICPGNAYVLAWMPLPDPFQPKEESK